MLLIAYYSIEYDKKTELCGLFASREVFDRFTKRHISAGPYYNGYLRRVQVISVKEV